MKKIIVIVVSFLLLPIFSANSAGLTDSVRGKILLQVESKGEAWYVNPQTNHRHFLGHPAQAFMLMRTQGLGVSNANLAKIRIAYTGDQTDTDSDGIPDQYEQFFGTSTMQADSDNDGYSDGQEVDNGYDPLSKGVRHYDSAFAQNLAGRILLQVERNGEAWYVNPENHLRYYLGSPADALALMRQIGLGISNSDLAQIDISDSENVVIIQPEIPESIIVNMTGRYAQVESGKRYRFTIDNATEIAEGCEHMKANGELEELINNEELVYFSFEECVVLDTGMGFEAVVVPMSPIASEGLNPPPDGREQSINWDDLEYEEDFTFEEYIKQINIPVQMEFEIILEPVVEPDLFFSEPIFRLDLRVLDSSYTEKQYMLGFNVYDAEQTLRAFGRFDTCEGDINECVYKIFGGVMDLVYYEGQEVANWIIPVDRGELVPGFYYSITQCLAKYVPIHNSIKQCIGTKE